MLGSSRPWLRARFGVALTTAIGAMLVALVLIAIAQIGLRYFFGNSLVWAEEASVILLLLMTWVGCPLLWLQRGHIAVNILTKGWSPRAQARFQLSTDFAVVPIGLTIAWLASRTAAANQGMELAGLNIDSSWKYVPVVVGGVLLALAGLVNVVSPAATAEVEPVL